MVDLSKCSPEHCGCDTPEMCTPENCPDTNVMDSTANNGCCTENSSQKPKIDLSKCSPEHCGCDTPEMCTPENCPDTDATDTAASSGCCTESANQKPKIDLSKCSPEHCGCDTPEMCTPENCPDTGVTSDCNSDVSASGNCNSNNSTNSCNDNANQQAKSSNDCDSKNIASMSQCNPNQSSAQQGCPVTERKFGADGGFTVPEMHDVIYPPVPFPSNRVFNVAGEEKIRELITLQHDLLRISPVKHLFAHSDRKFAILVARTADFFVEIFGGPQYFTPEHGQPKLRHRHFPFTISEKDRIVWLERMEQALIETNFPIELHEEIWNWVEPLSIRMINRRTNMDAIERLPYNTRERLLKVQ